MRKSKIQYIVVTLLSIFGYVQTARATEEPPCHVCLVQLPNITPGGSAELSEQETVQAIELAQKFSDRDISIIYASDDPYAQQVASLIAQYHDRPMCAHPTLRAILPNTLFQRVRDIKTFAMDVVEQNRGKTVIMVTHESMVVFIGRYLQGGFKKIPHFSYIEIYADGKSPYLSN